jgi:hypothetical protein
VLWTPAAPDHHTRHSAVRVCGRGPRTCSEAYRRFASTPPASTNPPAHNRATECADKSAGSRDLLAGGVVHRILVSVSLAETAASAAIGHRVRGGGADHGADQCPLPAASAAR